MLEVEPDIVVSGINNIANLGDDVIYSGTVAAAMEGRFLGLPAVAVSLVTADHKGQHYETAARAAVEIIARLKAEPLPADTILNVNVPDVAWDELRRVRSLAPGQPPPRRALHPAAGPARPAVVVDRSGRTRGRFRSRYRLSTPCAAAISRSPRSMLT